MRKIAILLIVSCQLLIVSCATAYAQEKATPSAITKSKIEEIKEKIASTVAQLNLVSKRVFVGDVTKLEKNLITIERGDEAKIIDVDELTKYSRFGPKTKEEIAFADLKIGDSIVAIGIYNKETRRLLARFVFVKILPIQISGVVREVDIKGGTISVEDKKRNTIFTVDIEKSTKTTNYTKAEGITKSGLSKIEIGQRAHIHGLPSNDEENRITATRILLLPAKTAGIATPSPAREATGAATSSSETTP